MESLISDTYRWPALPPPLDDLRVVVAEADPATLSLIVHTIGHASAAVFPAYDARAAV